MPIMNFKAWLVENHIKQKELCELLGISMTMVNAKVNGRSPWTLEQIKKICKKYSISADIFLREELQKSN